MVLLYLFIDALSYFLNFLISFYALMKDTTIEQFFNILESSLLHLLHPFHLLFFLVL